MDDDEAAATRAQHVVFRDPLWLEMNGLSEETWIHYLALSTEFYDPQCLNEQGRLQGLSVSAIAKLNVGRVGFEYVLLGFDPMRALIVIRKQKRFSPTQTSPIAHYYILHGSIYQGPSMLGVIESRLDKLLHKLKTGMALLAQHHHFDPSRGSGWKHIVGHTTDAAAAEDTHAIEMAPRLDAAGMALRETEKSAGTLLREGFDAAEAARAKDSKEDPATSEAAANAAAGGNGKARKRLKGGKAAGKGGAAVGAVGGSAGKNVKREARGKAQAAPKAKKRKR